MRCYIVFFFFLLSQSLFGQPPSIEWERVYGGANNDQFNDLCINSSNQITLIGYTASASSYIVNNHGLNDAWMLKIDSVGNILWSNCFGSILDEEGNSIFKTLDSGYIFISSAGFNGGDVHGSYNNGSDDYWIVKTDSHGQIQWSKCYGGSSDDFGQSIIQSMDSGFLIIGNTQSNDGDVVGYHGSDDIWALKLYPDSSIQWSKALGGSASDGVIGNKSCIQTPDGNFLIASDVASNDGNVSGNHAGNTSDAWVVKLNPVGQIIWQKCYGGTSVDGPYAIVSSQNGQFYLAGITASSDGDIINSIGSGDMWLIKADSVGNIIWNFCYGGTGLDEAHAMSKTLDGGIILAGTSRSNTGQVDTNYGNKDIWVAKLDSNGLFEWGKVLGGSLDDEAEAISQTSDGGFIIAGYTKSNDHDVSLNLGGRDGWIVKLSPAGLNINDPSYSIMDLTVLQSENRINLRFFSKYNLASQIEVYNISGQKIYESDFQVGDGINYYSLPHNFAAGIYCVQIKGIDFSVSKKFVVF